MTRHSRSGFTMIEVVIALAILAVVVLGLSGSAGTLIKAAGADRRDTQASAAVTARITKVRQWPDYASLDSFARVETDVPLPGWSRTTTVTLVGGTGKTNDYKRVTVTVAGPGLSQPVTRTITQAAP